MNSGGASKVKHKRQDNTVIPKIDLSKKATTIWTPNLERNDNKNENST